MNILCIGEVLCDVVMKAIDPEDFEKGRTVLNDFEIRGGGDGNNAAEDLNILGVNVRPFSYMGYDFLGDYVIKKLEDAGIDTRYIARSTDTNTSVSVLMIGSEGDVTAGSFHMGGSRLCTADQVPDEAFEWADHVHLVGVMSYPNMDGEGTGLLLEKAHRFGCTTSMDTNFGGNKNPGMHIIDAPLRHCDIFSPSHSEIEALTGISDPHEMAEYLKDYGLKVFAVKLGEKGVYVTDYKEEFIQPSLYRGVPVDVIGAGDAFSSTFAAAWKMGYTPRSAALLASAASSGVLAMVGSTTGMRPFDELVKQVLDEGYELEKENREL